MTASYSKVIRNTRAETVHLVPAEMVNSDWTASSLCGRASSLGRRRWIVADDLTLEVLPLCKMCTEAAGE